jgi:hypothetical protein
MPQLRNLTGVDEINILDMNGYDEINLEAMVDEPTVHIPLLIDRLMGAGARITQVEQKKASLGDVITAIAEDSA